MPFEDLHACRLRDSSDFENGSIRTIRAEGEPGLSILVGRLKGQTTTTRQSFRYDRNIWTERRAREHCQDNNGILFEPATGAD